MSELEAALREYLDQVSAIDCGVTTVEETYYVPIANLIETILRTLGLPFDVRAGASVPRMEERGFDRPDLVFLDDGDEPTVFGEVKSPGISLDALAISEDRNDQIGRYLAATGTVLLCNVHAFGLLVPTPGSRAVDGRIRPESRALVAEVDLRGVRKCERVREAAERLATLVEQVVADCSPISHPASLAKILARQAKAALAGLPTDLEAVRPLIDDYGAALGLSFEDGDERGQAFFRSTLIQTAYYSIFCAWALWHVAEDAEEFSDIKVDEYLNAIPFLRDLLHDLRHPRRLTALRLGPHLERAIRTFGRVDRTRFFARIPLSALAGSAPVQTAITYFYEPFLAAFDPSLKEDLGVWYTPSEIVQYQVRQVHNLLKREFHLDAGFADERVVVLDPACGTGAYLLEVVRCIAEEVRLREGEATVAIAVKEAMVSRLLGFELLTAPFAISQLQFLLVLKELGLSLEPGERLRINLTNSLTGWRGEPRQVHLQFPELRDELDAAENAKHQSRIIVVIGNPPYDRFTGLAIKEEAELVDNYKGIVRRPRVDRRGNIVTDDDGNAIMVQEGNSRLYEDWGVRKQLLDDLYIRFFRLAEERIGISADFGVVSMITNASYLVGRSHPIMRECLLRSFNSVWIDNLNGDKYRTGKTVPAGLPGAGTSDQSVFTNAFNPGGIQPGTAIATLLKRPGAAHTADQAEVYYRDFWGRAVEKRRLLLESLDNTGVAKITSLTDLPAYHQIAPTRANRWRLTPHQLDAGFGSWPGLDEIFPVSYQGVNPNRGMSDSLIDFEEGRLRRRMDAYFGAEEFEAARRAAPGLATERARYSPEEVWRRLIARRGTAVGRVQPYLLFPLDPRWIFHTVEEKLLNESRPDLAAGLEGNQFLITVPEPRQESEICPVFSRVLFDLHVHDRGAIGFPMWQPGLMGMREANLTQRFWGSISAKWGYCGTLADELAMSLAEKLICFSLAVLYSRNYRAENRSALKADFARLPIPRDREVFETVVTLGQTIRTLLDAEADATAIVRDIIGEVTYRSLGEIKRVDGRPIAHDDLIVQVSYFGAARGRYLVRPLNLGEAVPTGWTAETGDVFLGEGVLFANIPPSVWAFRIGGYPVLKKWLGDRHAVRCDGRPLSANERRHFRSMVGRIAAILTLQERLDELYSGCAANAFTADELGL